MTCLSHDAFARTELHRFTEATTETCAWCGGTRKHGKLFRYEIQKDDGGSPSRIKGLFCSVGCMRTYHS
jgi:hypothetical protein